MIQPSEFDGKRPVQLDRYVAMAAAVVACLLVAATWALMAPQQHSAEAGIPGGAFAAFATPQPLFSAAQPSPPDQAAVTSAELGEPGEAGEPQALAATEAYEPQLPQINLTKGKVKAGQTFSTLMQNVFTAQQIFTLANQCKDVFPLTRLAAGHAYSITTTDGGFQRFEYEIDGSEKLAIQTAQDGFEVCRMPIAYDVTLERVVGNVESSLYSAVAATGETPELAVRLADIFAWDVDFVREIRGGDSFAVLVEKRFREGKFAGYGRILAAEFVNQGMAHRGYLFEAVEGRPDYYDEDGRSLRKAFLKAPVDFRRISSRYSLRRLHPVLKVYRPHHGVDYAAPTGTPVKAAGDGTVIAVKRDHAAGRYIKIRHANGYESGYLHLSGYARGIRRGVKVRQGQVIGYVGSTGYATGPHLDFRMKKDGRYINPRALKTPPAAGVPQKMMGDFLALADQRRAQLAGADVMQAQASPHVEPRIAPVSLSRSLRVPAAQAL